MPESTHRRRPRGNGTVYPVGDRWRGSIFVSDENGRRTRRYVSGATQADALGRLGTAKADAQATAEHAKSPTLAWWATRWLGTVRLRVRTSTTRVYRWAIDCHIVPALGERPLIDLRPADIEAWLARLVDGGMASSTAAQVRRVLVVCLADAVRDGRIPRNVASSARPPRVEAVRPGRSSTRAGTAPGRGRPGPGGRRWSSPDRPTGRRPLARPPGTGGRR